MADWRILREWSQRLWGALHCGRRDADLEEEIRLHIELVRETAQRRGVEDGAARELRTKIGNEAQALSLLREQRGVAWIEDLVRDARLALRTFRREPAFAAVVILTLAIGIGANTAIFSIVNGVLLRPLSYPSPDRLMYISTQLPSLGFSQFPVSVAEYLEFQQFNRSFSDVGAFRIGQANLIAGDRALRVRSAVVDAHLLNTLGVQTTQGRLFSAGETGLVSPPPVALISYELWQSAFGARPIVGRSVIVDGRRLQILGIMARGSDLMDTHPQVWLSCTFTDSERRARDNHNLALIGRLKAGATLASTRVELNALTETWAMRAGIKPGTGHPGHVFLPLGNGQQGHALQMTPLTDQILGRVSRSIWMLQVAVLLVLLIACTNVANLLLARAETHRRELAVLIALGASRGRLVRKTLTESLILAAAGGAFGLLLARAVLDALVRTYPASLPRIGGVTVDLRVMFASLALSLASGLLFGLASTMYLRADATAEALKACSRVSGGVIRRHVRSALVIAETALAVIVVVGAGLLLRTVDNLNAVDGGFDRTHLVTFSVTLPPAASGLLGRVRVYQRLVERLRDMAGVRGATGMTSLPLEEPLSSLQTEIANRTPTSGPPIPSINHYQRVMSGFFETMSIPILEGRGFQSTDAASGGLVAVVNQTLAKTYWSGQSPIGQRLRPYSEDGASPWFTVVGVAKDVKLSGVDQSAGTQVYLLVDQLATDSPRTWVAISPTSMQMVIRTTLPPAVLSSTIVHAVHNVDPSIPVARLRQMDAVFTESIERPRLLARLLAGFSILALLLAAVGIYGVLAYLVAERRREIGIRMALGAGRSRVLGEIVNPGLRLTVAGVIAGTASAVLLNRLIASLLFGVEPTDARTFAAAILVIALIAAVASSLPAWRALRVDPNTVLRSE